MNQIEVCSIEQSRERTVCEVHSDINRLLNQVSAGVFLYRGKASSDLAALRNCLESVILGDVSYEDAGFRMAGPRDYLLSILRHA